MCIEIIIKLIIKYRLPVLAKVKAYELIIHSFIDYILHLNSAE